MKFTKDQKEILKARNFTDTDIKQIERATIKTVYMHITEDGKEKISIHKAIELLGIEDFLSGISRSAFHYTATRQIGDMPDYVSFDSRKLFQ